MTALTKSVLEVSYYDPWEPRRKGENVANYTVSDLGQARELAKALYKSIRLNPNYGSTFNVDFNYIEDENCIEIYPYYD